MKPSRFLQELPEEGAYEKWQVVEKISLPEHAGVPLEAGQDNES
jgi:hypothetical protein